MHVLTTRYLPHEDVMGEVYVRTHDALIALFVIVVLIFVPSTPQAEGGATKTPLVPGGQRRQDRDVPMDEWAIIGRASVPVT